MLNESYIKNNMATTAVCSSSFRSNPELYQFCSLLGQCSTDIGVVYLGRYCCNSALVALKKYDMEKISRKETQLIQDEIILMRQLNHPNVLPCLAAFVSGEDVVTVSPLMGYGSCHDLIIRNFNTGLPELLIAIILRDVLQALSYIHQKGIIHRAVRASHILVNQDGNAKLSGLRYACPLFDNGKLVKRVHSFPSTTLPNLNWLSPELLSQNLQGYDEKSDVYSVGITACELANGVVPFADTPTTVMLTEKVRGMAPQLLDCTTYVIYDDSSQGNVCFKPTPGDLGFGDSIIRSGANDHMREYSTRRFSDSFHDLNEMCCLCDPQERPTPAQLLSHAFFKQIRRNNHPLSELLLPAVPIMEENVPDMQDDLESLSAVDNLSALQLTCADWNF